MDDFSVDLMNAIRSEAPPYYQDSVPVATKENLMMTGTAILNGEITRNIFYHALLDTFGKTMIKNMLYNDPWEGIFNTFDMPFGKTIQEIFVDTMLPHGFNPIVAETEVFKREMPNIYSIFAEVNIREFYKSTTSEDLLRSAVTGQSQIDSLISKILTAMDTSKNHQNFIKKEHLLYLYAQEGKFYTVTVPPIIDKASLQNFMVKVRALSNELSRFLNRQYNYANVDNHAAKGDQVIIVDTDLEAEIDVKLLSDTFHENYAESYAKKVTISKGFAGIENAVAVLTTKNFINTAIQLLKPDAIYNPEGLYWNNFLHDHRCIYTSMFEPAILFVTDNNVLESIEINPKTPRVRKNGFVQFFPSPSFTSGYPSAKCTWKITGATSSLTEISMSGLLFIGYDETATTITVTATSVENTSISDTAEVTVI